TRCTSRTSPPPASCSIGRASSAWSHEYPGADPTARMVPIASYGRSRAGGRSRMKTAAEIRAGLSHPIVDADGHFVELGPLLNDEVLTYIDEMGGRELRDAYAKRSGVTDTSTVLADHAAAASNSGWKAMPSWWGWQTENTLDRATAHLPDLLYGRLDEFGIDVTILYPSMTLSYLEIHDDDLAALRCRAANRYLASLFAGKEDRCIVGALVPMTDPKMACAELEYAVRELGFKTAVFA